MRNILKRPPFTILLIIVVSGLIVSACDSADPEDTPLDDEMTNEVTSVSVRANQQRVIGIGTNIQVTAIARNAAGEEIMDAPFAWSSNDEGVATVNDRGEVITTGLGNAVITAETAGVRGSVDITALPAGIQQLQLEIPYRVLPDEGYTAQIDLIALNALGDPIENPQVSWSSSNVSVISVDETGQITTGQYGSADIFVESDDTEAILKLDVVATRGEGITELDLELLSVFKQNSSSGLLVAPPGMSAALVVEGRLVMARGYGIARETSGVSGELVQAVEPDTRFRIASVSKPFTAVSTLKLVEQGELSLEDSLLSVVPALIPPAGLRDERAREIRIWQLLEHKGGWNRDIGPNPLYHLRPIAEEMGVASPPSHETLAHWLFQQQLHVDPGSQYIYNNMNYFMLGQVIEAISGQPYETFVQQEILNPLGITSMQTGLTYQTGGLPNEAQYYYGGLGPSVFDEFPGTLPTQYGGGFDMQLMNASGGWIASAVDLARFGRAMHERAIINDQELHTYMITDNSGNGVYGAGWILDGRNYLHTGALEGSSSLLYVYEDGRVLALLFNGNVNVNFRRWQDAIEAIDDWPAIDLFGQY